jgi:hypothetical protein
MPPSVATLTPHGRRARVFVAPANGTVNVTHASLPGDGPHVTQPSMTRGPNDELLVQAYGSAVPHSHWSDLLVSRDGGRGWEVLTTWPNVGGAAVGVGWLRDGTLLTASGEFSEAVWRTTISRGVENSSGQWQWTPPMVLPTNGTLGNFSGGDNSIRFVEDDDGTVYYITNVHNHIPPHETRTRAVVFASVDGGARSACRQSSDLSTSRSPDSFHSCGLTASNSVRLTACGAAPPRARGVHSGRTFHPRGSLMGWSSESDLVCLGGGKLLAVTRYQTNNCSDSPTFHAPTIGRATGPRYQGTAVLTSDDSGWSWSSKGLVTVRHKRGVFVPFCVQK